jgi:hypothetical protein
VDENERTQNVFVHLIALMDSFQNFTPVIYEYKDPQNAGISGVSWCSRVQCTKKLAPCFLVHYALDLLLTPLIPAFLFTL